MPQDRDPLVARLLRCFTIVAIGLLLFAWLAYLAGVRINRTNSLPKGLYWVVNREPIRGDIITFWPDGSEPFRIARQRGYIIPGVYNDRGAGGYDLMMKKLLAIPGDIVSITDAGITVNGRLIPNTAPLRQDNMGDPLPVVRLDGYRLKENEALFVSDHLPRSFDARYFGIQDMGQIVEVLRPVLVW